MMFALIVVADQADVNRHEEHKDQRLNQSDQNFHKVKGNRQKPVYLRDEVEHTVKKAFSTKYISEEAEGQRYRAKQNGENFNEADGNENNS